MFHAQSNFYPLENQNGDQSRLKEESKAYLKHKTEKEYVGIETDHSSLVFSPGHKGNNRFPQV